MTHELFAVWSSFSCSSSCSAAPSGGFICDYCSGGKTGAQCDECAPGFYQDPQDLNKCIDCQCNLYGSYSNACDARGRCYCFPGILGERCDVCSERSTVVDGRCVSCLDGCTGLLFENIDKINLTFTQLNLTADHLLPWQKFLLIEQRVANLSKLDFLRPDEMPDMSALLDSTERLERDSSNLEAEAHIALSGGERLELDARELRSRAESLVADGGSDIDDVNQLVRDVIDQLTNRCVNLIYISIGIIKKVKNVKYIFVSVNTKAFITML